MIGKSIAQNIGELKKNLISNIVLDLSKKKHFWEHLVDWRFMEAQNDQKLLFHNWFRFRVCFY